MENKYTERIEAYLIGELSPQARADLEQAMKQDPALQAEFDNREMAHTAIDILIEDDLRATLRALEAKKDTPIVAAPEATVRTMNKGRSRRLFLLSVAAGIVLLVGFFGLQFFGGSGTPSNQLAMDYYERPSFEQRGQVEFFRLENGLAVMRENDYKAAIPFFDSIPEGDDYYVGAQYNRAHALYLLHDFEAAQAGFSVAAKGGDSRYTEKAAWYELLSCFAAKKETGCKALLDAIIRDEGHSYYQKAKDLKSKL